MPVPGAMQNAPELMFGLELFYAAFLDLNTCRGGMGDGAIGWLSMSEYCLAIGLDAEATDDLQYHVSLMDQAYLKHQKRKSEGK